VHLAREVIVADETYFSRLLDASPCRAPHLKWVSQLLAEFDEASFAGEGLHGTTCTGGIRGLLLVHVWWNNFSS
jgi:hypothetical protein